MFRKASELTEVFLCFSVVVFLFFLHLIMKYFHPSVTGQCWGLAWWPAEDRSSLSTHHHSLCCCHHRWPRLQPPWVWKYLPFTGQPSWAKCKRNDKHHDACLITAHYNQFMLSASVCVCVCMRVRAYRHACECACMCAFLYACMHMCVWVQVGVVIVLVCLWVCGCCFSCDGEAMGGRNMDNDCTLNWSQKWCFMLFYYS